MNTVLVIDDETNIRGLLSRIIGLEGYEVVQAVDCRSALKEIEAYRPQVALCDVFLPDGNGVDLIPELKKRSPGTEVIMLTAHGNIPDGVRAIKNGAFDYLTKGDDNNKIIPLLARAMEKAREYGQPDAAGTDTSAGAEKSGRPLPFKAILGRSQAIKRSAELARKVAATDVPVLLTGETGTGKEVFARAIHGAGKRAENNFVAVNCAAFSRELLESELFGHKAGAFTGAVRDKKGLLEEAEGGTVFLDEIGEMAFDLQAKLLRVLENGEYIKVGDTKTVRADVRIIAATNRDLQKEIAAGRFREDLYYRLSVFAIHLPPLRERPDDIPALTRSFIDAFAARLGTAAPETSPGYMDALKKQIWRGNIRELRNAVERSMIVSDGVCLEAQDLPLEIQGARNETPDAPDSMELSAVERRHIARVLEHTRWNKTETARLLRIGLTTLYRKIEEYGIVPAQGGPSQQT